MNDYFEITEKSAENVLQNAERIFKEAPLRRGGSDGERKASDMLFNEIKPPRRTILPLSAAAHGRFSERK